MLMQNNKQMTKFHRFLTVPIAFIYL